MTKFKIAAIAGVLGLASQTASAERFDAEDVVVENFTGAVKVSTHTGDGVEVSIRQGKVFQTLKVVEEDGVVSIVAEPWREEEFRDCCNDKITRTVNLRRNRGAGEGDRLADAFFDDYPSLEIQMPRAGDLSFVDARMNIAMGSLDGELNLDACYAYGEIGDLGSAIVGVVSGSRLVIGDVASALEVDLSGDADLLAGDVAMVDADIAGPGDIILGAVDGMMDVSVAGSGVVRADRLDGPMTVRVAGSGGVIVKDGRADGLQATIDGSGGVYFGGVAIRPDLRLHGSSEVKLGSINGRIRHSGTGDVFVDGKKVDKGER